MRICKNKTIPVFLYEPYNRKFYVQVNATNMVLTGRMSFKPASQINCHRIADSKQKQVSVNFFSFFFFTESFCDMSVEHILHHKLDVMVRLHP